MTAIVGTEFKRLNALAQTLGAWEHPTLGRLTAERVGNAVRVHNGGVALTLHPHRWLDQFDGMPKGADAWRRATVSAKTSASACTIAR